MSEQWENVIEHEIEFYNNYPIFKEDLMEQLYRSQIIRYPVTIFDEHQGRVYFSNQRTEDQAFRRIEVKEAIESLLNKAQKRIQRFFNAVDQLDELEQDIIWDFYILKDMPVNRLPRFHGFRTKNDFMKAKQKALKKLFEIYQKDRPENEELRKKCEHI